jgi:peptide/nickel transport system substrate-binding protein
LEEIRRRSLLTAVSAMKLISSVKYARAASRSETLRIVTGGVVNTLDPMMLGSTREAINLSVCTYDRLVISGRKQTSEGLVYDYDTMKGELAESFEVSTDGKTIRFNLRRNATWQDGSPVTSEDIKWSLDRNVSAAGMAKAQISTGSLLAPEQFRIIDTHRIEIDLPDPDRLALPNLCIPYSPMYQGSLAKRHATARDPWAGDWLKANLASSGAYSIEQFRPGAQVILRRNDNWTSNADGKLPFFQRIIVQTVPESSTRASLVERGDADFVIDLGANDVTALQKSGQVKVIAMPPPAGIAILSMNTQIQPFDNKLVRQAIAAALPYEALFQGALLGRGKKLYGADWQNGPPSGDYPQPLPYKTDLDLARSKMKQAGMLAGFKTSLSFAVSNAPVGEPLAALTQEALGKIGIELEIRKLTDPQYSTQMNDKTMAMIFEANTGALFPSTDYAFRIYLSSKRRSNYSCFENPQVDALIAKARFERDRVKYEALTKQMIALAVDETPMILLWQQDVNAVMTKDIDGYSLREIRQEDPRDLRRV